MPNRLSAFFYGEKAHDRENVTVFDIGCSGGVGAEWNIFGPALRAVGFDPLVTEIERLKRSDRRSHIRYEAAFVGLSASQERERDTHERELSQRRKFYPNKLERFSSNLGHSLLCLDYRKEVFNAGVEPIHSSCRISVDEFTAQQTEISIDVLKTDTDGHDTEVLIGAHTALKSTAVAAKIECFFHRQISPYSNSFANVDRIMTGHRFYLFDIKHYTYTRGALPGPFQFEILAQTINGAPVWADVLYLRDLAHPNYEAIFGFAATPERIIKTACLMEAFGLAVAPRS